MRKSHLQRTKQFVPLVSLNVWASVVVAFVLVLAASSPNDCRCDAFVPSSTVHDDGDDSGVAGHHQTTTIPPPASSRFTKFTDHNPENPIANTDNLNSNTLSSRDLNHDDMNYNNNNKRNNKINNNNDRMDTNDNNAKLFDNLNNYNINNYRYHPKVNSNMNSGDHMAPDSILPPSLSPEHPFSHSSSSPTPTTSSHSSSTPPSALPWSSISSTTSDLSSSSSGHTASSTTPTTTSKQSTSSSVAQHPVSFTRLRPTASQLARPNLYTDSPRACLCTAESLRPTSDDIPLGATGGEILVTRPSACVCHGQTASPGSAQLKRFWDRVQPHWPPNVPRPEDLVNPTSRPGETDNTRDRNRDKKGVDDPSDDEHDQGVRGRDRDRNPTRVPKDDLDEESDYDRRWRGLVRDVGQEFETGVRSLGQGAKRLWEQLPKPTIRW